MGPLLFILYINDLLRLLSNNSFAYTDDISIVVDHINLECAKRNMQLFLNKVTMWCHVNGLIMYALKTKIMHIHQPHIKKVLINIKIHSHEYLHRIRDPNLKNVLDTNEIELELVDNFNYLGVLIDSNFKLSLQIGKLMIIVFIFCHFFCNKST